MALNEGGMQYLIAGARANVGLKGGRHVFEAVPAWTPHGSGMKLGSPWKSHHLSNGVARISHNLHLEVKCNICKIM